MLACWFKQLSLLKQIINLLETAICCFGYDLKNHDFYNVQPWFWSIFFWIEVASTIPNISLASRYDVASFLTYRVTCAGELVRVFYNEFVYPLIAVAAFEIVITLNLKSINQQCNGFLAHVIICIFSTLFVWPHLILQQDAGEHFMIVFNSRFWETSFLIYIAGYGLLNKANIVQLGLKLDSLPSRGASSIRPKAWYFTIWDCLLNMEN